jgi:hypothetical protein
MEIAVGGSVFRDIVKAKQNGWDVVTRTNSLTYFNDSLTFGLGGGHPCYVGC